MSVVSLVPLKIFAYSLVIVSTFSSSQGFKHIQIYNRHAKKCLSFTDSGGLDVDDCRSIHVYGTLLNWTTTRNIKEAYTKKITCIQYVNSSLTTGDCNSRNTVQWSCEGNKLRSTTQGWYLYWDAERNKVETRNSVTEKAGEWLLLDTDNNICTALPGGGHVPTTDEPFTQPPTSTKERKPSAQLWPRGIYALPKASSGCPASTNFTWLEGWVYQDLDDTGEIKTKSSSSFNMAAHIDDYGNIKRWFCTKDYEVDGEEERPSWPNGTYCIYAGGYRKCPTSVGDTKFHFGFGFWDNTFWINNSKQKGKVPYYSYTPGGRTKIIFCCQSTEDPDNAVSLPTDQPFYLLAYRSPVCQKVKWATVISEFVVYDTADFLNRDMFSTFVPFNATKSDPKIYYCYYQSCNHSIDLDNSRSQHEITFPDSPFIDITSQSCSWHIHASPEHNISLHFSYFNIPAENSTNCSDQFVEIQNSNLQRNGSIERFCGNQSFTVNAQANSVLVILNLSHNVNNRTGFNLIIKRIFTEAPLSSEAPTESHSSRRPPTSVETSSPSTSEETSSPSTSEETSSPSTSEETSSPSTSEETSSPSEEPSLAKATGKKVSTVSIIIPVAIVVLVAIILIAFAIKRKRKKKCKDSVVVAFENNSAAQENPVYEGHDEGNDSSNAGKSSLSIYYDSIDDVRSTTRETTISLDTKPESVHRNHERDNPLYESSEQTEYGSNTNPLYSSYA